MACYRTNKTQSRRKRAPLDVCLGVQPEEDNASDHTDQNVHDHLTNRGGWIPHHILESSAGRHCNLLGGEISMLASCDVERVHARMRGYAWILTSFSQSRKESITTFTGKIQSILHRANFHIIYIHTPTLNLSPHTCTCRHACLSLSLGDST